MRAGEPLIDWAWIGSHLDDIAYRTVQHLALAGIAVAVGFVIAFILSLWAVRHARVRGPLTAIAGALYTIPGLALFAALLPITGISILTAEIPLVIYTQQILIRNIIAGFDAVPADVREAADAMGYTRRERLWRVELPLAVPLIVTGIRLAAVTSIGLVMLLTLIGDNFGALGLFIKEGIQTFFATKVYVGAILSVALAVIVDVLLVRVERRLTPWSTPQGPGGAAGSTAEASPAQANAAPAGA